MMIFDQVMGFVLGLVMVGMIVYAGVLVMDKMSTAANISADSKFYTMTTTIDETMNEGISWVEIIIVASAAVIVLGLLFTFFARG